MSARQSVIQKLLISKLAEHQARNPSYSLRAFARKLGVSPSTVSMIIGGSRPVSAKLAGRLCDALMLDPRARQAALSQLEGERGKGRGGQTRHVPANYLQLSADRFRMMSEWHCFGILSLMKTRGFRAEPSWIASRLGVTATEARSAIERMKRLGILVEDRDGALRREAPQYTTTDDAADMSVRKSHFDGLELARRSLERDPVDARDFTYLTFPLDPRFLPEAKRMIREFQDRLDARLAELDPEPTEVYRLAVSLFPLSRPAGSGEPPREAKSRKNGERQP